MTGHMRCAEFARRERLDPVGSAGNYSGMLLVELPLPWQSRIEDMEEIAAAVTALGVARKQRYRVQAVVPRGKVRRLTMYETKGECSFGIERRTLTVSENVYGAVIALAEGRGTSMDGQLGDVLVCTHGRRDQCCGSMGSRLAIELAPIWESLAPAGVQLWRTSHTGGHRFAPTFMVLPEGTVWGYADAELLKRVVHRSGSPDSVLDRYRGCIWLRSSALQALEREVIRRAGWEVLDRPRRGLELEDGRVGIEVRQSDRRVHVWEASVFQQGTVEIPKCGSGSMSGGTVCREFVVANVQDRIV